jgi:small subunit ribosomal protein S20
VGGNGVVVVPNIKSAIKRVHVAERKRKRNRAVKSSVRTFVKSAEKSIVSATAGPEVTRESIQRALKALDSAASKGVIHKNNAARRKSRLMKKLNASAPSA